MNASAERISTDTTAHSACGEMQQEIIQLLKAHALGGSTSTSNMWPYSDMYLGDTHPV